MTVPDLNELTLEELRDWISALNQRHAQLEAERRAEAVQRRESVAAAIADLEGLLGPESGEPGVGDIRAVRRYAPEVMAQNSGVALALAFEGMEQLTETVLEIAHVLAAQSSK